MTGCTPESERCDYWTQGGAYLRPACCTAYLKELLFFTHELLQRHDIPHWLDFGPLLGAVRGGEFIPWDGDVDFGIFKRDLERVRELEGEVAAAGHHLNMESPLVWRIELSRTNALHADLFPWWEDGEVLKMRWPGYSDDTWAFPRSYVENLQPVELYGGCFPAPAPLHTLLESYRYGSDYMVPLRTEELALRARLAAPLRRFVARRMFQDRLQRNLELFHQTLASTALSCRFRVRMEPMPGRPSPANDSPDAALAYDSAPREILINAFASLQAAGFALQQSGSELDDGRHRFIKDGACFELFEDVSTETCA